MISVLVPTLNEEANIERCLEGVSWADDVVVFDSFSSDRTVEIARTLGARVFQRRFDDYGSQREAARVEVDYRHPWVLAIDADERVDDRLAAELREVASSTASRHAAYRMRRKDHFMGRWIKRSTLYPSWFIRFYRPDRVRYEKRAVHEYPVVDGSVGRLEGHLLHDNFSKGLHDWIGRHNRYAVLEARESLEVLRGRPIDWRGTLAWGDAVRRRRALKELSMRLPFRPALRFGYMYLLRGGMLDGRPGLVYCRLLAFYEYLIVLNMREMRRRERSGAS